MTGPASRWIGVGALVASLAAPGCRDARRDTPHSAFLVDAWTAYKSAYIHADGYVLDRTRGQGEVTSEGQGYALLRAAWMRDEPTFVRILAWTEQRLQRPDRLFSWRWTPAGGGRLLDENTATDADQEIAFALILGSLTFDKPEFRARASAILTAIRTHAAIQLPGGWFPAAGNWAVPERVANLSYFMPYAYPYFQRVDPHGTWDKLSEVGYDLLAATMGIQGTRLPPDLIQLTADGQVRFRPSGSDGADFTSDGMRIPWRIAFDCLLHASVRACADPLPAARLTDLLGRDGSLYTRYSAAGTPLERVESYSFYGAALPYLRLFAPASATAISANKLNQRTRDGLMNRDGGRYYDANWVWFGLAAENGDLVRRTPRADSFR